MSINPTSGFITITPYVKSETITMQAQQNTSHENQKKSDRCRFCAVVLKREGVIDFSANTAVFKEYLDMTEVLKLDYLNLNDFKLPKTICNSCHINFKSAYNFFNQVRISQALLNALYSHDIKRELVDTSIVKEEIEEVDTDLNYVEEKTLFSKDSNEEDPTPYMTVPVQFAQASIKRQSPEDNNTPNILSSRKHPKLSENVCKNATESLLQNSELDDGDDRNFHNLTYYDVPLIDSAANLRRQTLLSNILVVDDSNSNKNISGTPKPSTTIEVSIDSSLNQSNTETSHYSISSSSNESEIDNFQATDYLLPISKYCDVSVYDSDTPEEIKGSDNSWTSYPWTCKHCNENFESMTEVREHSKILHGMCYGYDCADCEDQFNTFHAFIEHVRQHRDELRYYCQFCNVKFESHVHCSEHSLSHWIDGRKVCAWCGEMFADAEALRSHRAAYRLAILPRRDYRRRPRRVTPAFTYNGVPVFHEMHATSWNDYEWTCVECSMRVPSVDSLRAHARDFHERCFAMKCVDCLKVVSNYRMFVKHVTGHRPHLKQYCQFCNEHFENEADQEKHVNDHLTGPVKPCDGCGQIFENKTLLLQHLHKYDPPRIKGTLTTEDLTCEVCERVFKNMGHLRSHRKTHEENRKRDHVCDTCGKAFYSLNTLQSHVTSHSTVKTEVCELCKKEFPTVQRLRAHVVSHLDTRMFTCDECGKSFKKKEGLKGHIYSHMDVTLFKCLVCKKGFKHKNNLDTHMNQHTGLRPYSCKHCDKTFTNWANCNKHMLRKHKDTLAKTKMTPHGRLEINKETLKVEKIRTDEETEKWLNNLMKPAKRGKKIGSKIKK